MYQAKEFKVQTWHSLVSVPSAVNLQYDNGELEIMRGIMTAEAVISDYLPGKGSHIILLFFKNSEFLWKRKASTKLLLSNEDFILLYKDVTSGRDMKVMNLNAKLKIGCFVWLILVLVLPKAPVFVKCTTRGKTARLNSRCWNL